MGTQALQKPLNPKAVKAANAKVSVASTSAQKSAWLAEYQTALKKINSLSTSGANANKKKGNTKATQPCTKSGCLITKLTIEGSHNTKRNYKLELPAATLVKGTTAPLKKDFFQVLGGFSKAGVVKESTGAKLKIQYVGTCNTGTPNCPSVTIVGPKLNETFIEKTKSFDVFSADPEIANSFTQNIMPFAFFARKVIFPTETPRQSYSVSTKGCGTHKPYNATVEVITPVSWGGKFTWGWEKQPWKNDQFKTRKHIRKFVFGGEVSGKYEEKNFKVSFTHDKKGSPGSTIEKILSLGEKFLNAMKFLDDISDNLGNAPTRARNKKLANPVSLAKGMTPEIKFDIHWPKFVVEGKVANVEVPGKYLVATEGSIKIGADPLFGAAINTDILDWIAAMWPPLLKIKKIAAEGIETENVGAKVVIAIILGLEADFKCDVEVKYNKEDWSVSGGVEGVFSLVLKGEVYAEGRVWRISIGIGAAISLQSADNTSESPGIRGKLGVQKTSDTEFGFTGGLFFTGAKLFAVYYAYVGVKEVETTENKNSRGDNISPDKDIVKHEERELKEVKHLFDPYQIYP